MSNKTNCYWLVKKQAAADDDALEWWQLTMMTMMMMMVMMIKMIMMTTNGQRTNEAKQTAERQRPVEVESSSFESKAWSTVNGFQAVDVDLYLDYMRIKSQEPV